MRIGDQLKALESRVRKLEGVRTEEELLILSDVQVSALQEIGWVQPEGTLLIIVKTLWLEGMAEGWQNGGRR